MESLAPPPRPSVVNIFVSHRAAGKKLEPGQEMIPRQDFVLVTKVLHPSPQQKALHLGFLKISINFFLI